MVIDIVILVVALGVAVGVTFFGRVLSRAWLLVPVDTEQPVPKRPEPVRYRLRTLGEVKDRTTIRPRLLLVLVLFALLALAGKLVLNPQPDWSVVVLGIAGVTLGAIFSAGGMQNLLTVALITVLPFYLTAWMTEWFGWTENPWQKVGLGAGLIIGASAGVFLARNYIGMVRETRLELRHRQRLDGKAIGGLGRAYRRVYLLALYVLPVVIAYQVLTGFVPGLAIAAIDDATPVMGGGDAGGTVGWVAGFVLGLNAIFFAIPLFRQMIEKGSFQSGADFTLYAAAALRKDHPDDKRIQEKTSAVIGDRRVFGNPHHQVKGSLGRDGRWLHFATNQVFPLVCVAIYLVTTALHETLARAFHASAIPTVGTLGFDGANVVFLIQILGGMPLVAGLFYLIGMLGYWAAKHNRGGQREAQEANTDAVWRAVREPDLTVTCTWLGAEPKLTPTDTTSAAGTAGDGDDVADPSD